jgi:hypothetical protein
MIDTAESLRALNGTADVSDAGHSHESNLNSSHGQLEVRSLPAADTAATGPSSWPARRDWTPEGAYRRGCSEQYPALLMHSRSPPL